MIIRGILERSLGGFICVRGYAPLNMLSKISKSNLTYQRDLDKNHCKELGVFLGGLEYIYFPEITLSYTLNEQLDNIKLSSGASLLELSSPKGKVVVAKQFDKAYSSSKDQRDKELIKIVSFEIDDDKGLGLFNRIDGNHRLNASEHIESHRAEILTPFCLILFSDEDDINAKQQSVIFHNINSKGLSLTPEENLKGIIDGNRFSDDELKETFGWEYVKARKILHEIDMDYLCSLQHVFDERPRNSLLSALKFLSGRDLINEGTSIRSFKQKLTEVNAVYKEEPRFLMCNEVGIFTCFLNYAFKMMDGVNLLHSFKNWLLFNHIDEIKALDAAGVVDVFDRVHSAQLNIFMAMPYYNNEEVDYANESLSSAVATIQSKNPHINLANYPVMRTSSPSHDVIADIFNKIKTCSIFIADITNNNANVLYEYGFAKGQNKDCIVIRKKDAVEAVKSDFANDLRFEYGTYDLEEKLKIQLEHVLEANGIVITK